MRTILLILASVFVSDIAVSDTSKDLMRHSYAEYKHEFKYKHLATGKLYGRMGWTKHNTKWPVQIKSIGHTIASYQKYGFGSPYFHHGIDIRADAASDVIAARGGLVVNIENYVPGDPAYWEVAILDSEGFIWQYHHVNKQSIPREIYEAYKNKRAIPVGTKIGEVYKWPVKTFGEYFHHIHLNVLGENGRYVNPLLFLKRLPDKVAPKVTEIRILSQKGISRSISSGKPYTLVAIAEDLMLHEHFKIPPYHTWISINGRKPHTVWKFDSLPGGDSKTSFVHHFFVKQWTCGNYRCRKFALNLGFYRGRQISFPTEPGRYSAIVGVEDVYGNKSQKSFSWQVE